MQQQWQIFRRLAVAGSFVILINLFTTGIICAEEKASTKVQEVSKKPVPVVTFDKDGIPYASEPKFKAAYGIDGTAYVPEHIPDVLQPMGLRPRGLLMRQIKTIPTEAMTASDSDISVKEDKKDDADSNNAEIVNAEKKIEDKPEENLPKEVERSLEPFLKWLESEEAQEIARKEHEKYKQTKDLKPSYDKDNRVFFEMRFPYSGAQTKGSENGKSAVMYTTPSKQ